MDRAQVDLNIARLFVSFRSRSEESVLFWVIYLPRWPGETVWAEVTLDGSRNRLKALWPPRQGLPFGVDGEARNSCFSHMANAYEAEAHIKHGDDTWRIASVAHLDEIARARWGYSEHVRACFGIDISGDFSTAQSFRIRVVNNQETFADRMIQIDKL
jgi:hypothetical protein